MKPLNDAAGGKAKLRAIGTTGVLPANSIGKAEASAQAAQYLHSCCTGALCGWSGAWQPAMAMVSPDVAIGSAAPRFATVQACMAEYANACAGRASISRNRWSRARTREVQSKSESRPRGRDTRIRVPRMAGLGHERRLRGS